MVGAPLLENSRYTVLKHFDHLKKRQPYLVGSSASESAGLDWFTGLAGLVDRFPSLTVIVLTTGLGEGTNLLGLLDDVVCTGLDFTGLVFTGLGFAGLNFNGLTYK